MKIEIKTSQVVWKKFEKAARRHRRDPARLLNAYVRECLEVWEAQELDEQIRREAQKSGYTEDDAVEILRQYRREKRQGPGAS